MKTEPTIPPDDAQMPDNTAPAGSPCLLLTATVDIKGMVFTSRADPQMRLDDYKRALRLWLATPSISRLVFCENSLYDLSEIEATIRRHNQHNKEVEVLSFDGQDFPRSLGKGYGEMKILSYIADNSRLFRNSQSFIKVTGRLYVKNINALASYMRTNEVDVVCELARNLSWADSRCFGGETSFLSRYLLSMQGYLDDSRGMYFEHGLARAAHKAMSEGKSWSLLPAAPDIVGVSGTVGVSYRTRMVRRPAKKLLHRAKRSVFLCR